jgi:hypothetical protein
MVKFLDVDINEIPNLRESHRGRVSYPILKTFMELNAPIKRLDRTGMQQNLQTLTSCLTAYVRNHNLPVELFTRQGEIYLVRKDLNMDGTPNENYEPPNGSRGAQPIAPQELHDIEDQIPAVDASEVVRKFKTEKDKALK